MILHIPHSSYNTLGYEFLSDPTKEIELLTDHQTDVLFHLDGVARLVFPVSRIVCDVERFEDDNFEPMSKVGMGVCYEKTTSGLPLRIVSDEDRKFIIDNYYSPHHKRLSDLVELELQDYGQALIIDCHSFPDQPLPCDLDQNMNRPDVCIGTDPFHTSNTLIQLTKCYFSRIGYRVSVNAPYSGTMVPLRYYRKDKRVESVMIEINRNLYLDGIRKIKREIRGYLELLHNQELKNM